MLCWYCNRVKGKRSCPARAGELICPRCCGTKRRIEIHCPEDCPYLYGEHDARWESPARQLEEKRFLSHFAGLEREQVPLLVFLHVLLVQIREDLGGDLSDREALDVVSTLARTYDTLSKGILYEHQSASPKLQAVVGKLGRFLAKRAEIPAAPRATDAEILAVLRAIEAALLSHTRGVSSPRSYLDSADRTFKPSGEGLPTVEVPGESGQGRLIVEP